MALNPLMLEKLLSDVEKGDAIASMGYPDIIYPPEKLREALGDKILGLKYREDSPAICKRHGIAQRDIPDAESLFELLGASLDVFDVVQERGCETIVDLNYPIPAQACDQFNWVLDVGTMEHCFNAPQALVNMAALLKVGGHVLHENPFNWGNHGFWNLNPTLFHDFYGDNGFEVLGCWLLPRGSNEIYECPKAGRFQYLKSEANLFTIARKVDQVEIKFPVQAKYRHLIKG